jgi:hypothetical protein
MSSSFRQQQGFDKFNSAEALQELIDKLIDKKLNHLKFCRVESAKVLLVHDDTNRADIGFEDGNDTIIQNVKIREGLTIEQGDQVYIMLYNNSASNIEIWTKMG